MSSYLWSVPIWLGIVLQVLVIASLLRGPYRQFKTFFVYTIALFLSTVAATAEFYGRGKSPLPAVVYWTCDVAIQMLVFVVVISLMYQAARSGDKQRAMRRALVGGAVVFIAVSTYFTWNPVVSRWMTQLSRNLGFAAVILNLILWAALIRSSPVNRTLLMLSGGFGIEMAGQAIGHSFRQISRSLILTGDIIIVITSLVCLYIWWQAFRSFDRSPAER